jgi:3-hydroxyacyl-CoA dehydrogenase
MAVFRAGVVGAGTMGGAIAHVIAAAGIPVVLKDLDPERVDAGLAHARSLWQAQVDSGKLELQALERAYGLIEGATDYEGFGDVDFVIEAVPEQIELKQLVFAELDEVTPGNAILASNTSALPITEIADATIRPEQVVGFHFFYPAATSRLVEIVEGEYTSPETLQGASSFAQAIRKSPIRCGEAPGFVVNRILLSSVAEIWRVQQQTGASFAEIDEAIAAARPGTFGPFRLADQLGLDTVLSVAEFLEEAYGERFAVHPRLRELVAAGDLGRKTGRGFYEHG